MTVARDGTGAAPATGEPVGRMLDLTPNAVNAIAPTDAARPLLTADGAVSFDGVDDHFALSSSIPITEEMTVVRAFGRSAAGIFSDGIATTSTSQPNDATWFSNNITYARLWDGTSTIATATGDTATGAFVHTTRRNENTLTVRRNGTQISTGSALAASGVFSVLGRRSSNYNNGPISFLAVFDRELTGAELELVESIAAGTNGATLA